jgi:hypothetical protein
MKDNLLKMKEMKDMKDFSTHPYREKGYMPLPLAHEEDDDAIYI